MLMWKNILSTILSKVRRLFSAKTSSRRECPLIFLHSPIDEKTQDIIGVDTYVDKLNSAIDAGAQMLAITSKFGSGKSSIIELLAKRRKGGSYKREQIIKLSMWSQGNLSTTTSKNSRREDSHENASRKILVDLHRAFVYQLASLIDSKKGTYISKRLSKNYGLLKLGINRPFFWLWLGIALCLIAFGWLLIEQPYLLGCSVLLKIPSGVYSSVSIIGGAILGLFILARADIIFSTNKSEGGREIEEDEIIDIYRTEILGRSRNKRLRKFRKHYIVVVEDMDRALSENAAIEFLIELRKYYVVACDAKEFYKNKVSFIINIKPEKMLEYEQNGVPPTSSRPGESLYPKLFDFILNLRPINIDNYDAILDGLLKEKATAIKNAGIPAKEDEKFLGIKGIKWIIYGERLGIREIKDRLNIAFSLFQSLNEKYAEESSIEFEKCAVVAYLSTEFENEFQETKDRAFQRLVHHYIEHDNFDDAACKEYLQVDSPTYFEAVKNLISDKHIDDTYRTYFYNYPKGSPLYSVEGLIAHNAILYGDSSGDIDINAAAERARASNQEAIVDAFATIRDLNKKLPNIVLRTEALYLEAVRLHFNGVKNWVSGLNYSDPEKTKTIDTLYNILSFDKERMCFKQYHAEDLCAIWEKAPEETILRIRQMLCTNYKDEITWYISLYGDNHAIITVDEMNKLSLADALELLMVSSHEPSIDHIKCINEKYKTADHMNKALVKGIEVQYNEAVNTLGVGIMIPYLIEFMSIVGHIYTHYESNILKYIQSNAENGEEYFKAYQQLINQIAETGLDKNTLDFINQIDRYEGYSIKVCEQLYQGGNLLAFVLIAFHTPGIRIPFESDEICTELKVGVAWIKDYHPELFGALRKEIVLNQKLLPSYRFMFSEEFPFITLEELNAIADESLAISLMPVSLIKVEHAVMFAQYFGRERHNKSDTYNVLKFISSLAPDVAKECFFALDFESIPYRNLHKQKKEETKELFFVSLNLAEATGKMNFMNVTECLDEAFEEELKPALKDDRELQTKYIRIVNADGVELTKVTLSVLYTMDIHYAMAPQIQEAFFADKAYKYYVVSKTLNDNGFTFEQGERGQALWDTYVEIYCKESNLTDTKNHMAKNRDFVQKIMDNNLYLGMSEDDRLRMCGIYQDAACLKNVLTYGTEFALKYLCSIDGFSNYDAAAAFIEIIKDVPELIKSQELYDHAYDKLENSALKASYTQLRNYRG